MTALEKQGKIKEVLSRMCGWYGKCHFCDFFTNKDNTDGKYFCIIRDSENHVPFEHEWDIASAIISDRNEHQQNNKQIIESFYSGKERGMKITDNSLYEKMLFDSLELEDIFKFDDRIFMKVSNKYGVEPNAYDFSKNRLTSMSEDTKVSYVPSELILHEKNWNEVRENEI